MTQPAWLLTQNIFVNLASDQALAAREKIRADRLLEIRISSLGQRLPERRAGQRQVGQRSVAHAKPSLSADGRRGAAPPAPTRKPAKPAAPGTRSATAAEAAPTSKSFSVSAGSCGESTKTSKPCGSTSGCATPPAVRRSNTNCATAV
jgi:hypothetical protein